MKIFKNGKIQMTGLKAIDNGIKAINILIDYIKNIHTEKNNILDKIEDVKLTNYKICLINSDFKFEHKIRRNDLHLFITKNTGLVCSYEPCIYPGVKIQYFYNDDNDGECKCSEYCDNKKIILIVRKSLLLFLNLDVLLLLEQKILIKLIQLMILLII